MSALNVLGSNNYEIFTLNQHVLAEENQDDNMKFGMQAVLTSVPGKGDHLAEIMRRAAMVVAGLEGCELYLVQQSLTDENKIFISELWSTKKDHENSLSNETVRALITEARPLISDMSGNPAKLIGGHGIN